MAHIFVAIQMFTLFLIFLIFYQIRKQYLISLNDFGSSVSDHAHEILTSAVNASQKTETSPTNFSAPATAKPSAKPLQSFEKANNMHQEILDDYIGDFFSSGSTPSKKSESSIEPLREIESFEAMNDDFITVAQKV